MAPRIVLAAVAAIPLLLARSGARTTPVTASRPAMPRPATAPAVAPPADVLIRRGIDVSHHQGTINWDAVAGDGVEFAWMKATEGATFRDASFARNWHQAGAAGLARGAYH